MNFILHYNNKIYFNSRIKNMFIIDEVYSSHRMYELHFSVYFLINEKIWTRNDQKIFDLTFKFTSWAKWISVALNKANVTDK